MLLTIIEDDRMLMENLRLLLGGEPGIRVLSAFSNAEEAVAAFKTRSPEVMLVDLGLPKMSGIELIRVVKQMHPETEIIVHTISEDRPTVFAALKAGASGYILKGSTPRELIEALFEVHKGGAPMSPKIARMVIREFQEEAEQEQQLLTMREKEILVNLEKGLTYKEIAGLLNISPHTVHTHIKNIYEKLQARDRHEALRKAIRTGAI
ncbi:MAG: response regulator transcription factor [Syntrophobacter sp.]